MVEYSIINGVTFALGTIFLYNGYRMVKTGREDIALFVTSGIIGVGLIVVALYPGIFQLVANVVGLELKARAILVVSNLAQFVLIVYLFNRIGRLYDKLSVLNEELSLLTTEVEERQND